MSTIKHTHWQLAQQTFSDQFVAGLDDVHQCIEQILATRKGSDILRPQFGSNHYDYIDQPMDIAIPNIVREVFEAIKAWESRAIVERVVVTDLAPQVLLTVHWRLVDQVVREIYQTEVRA